MVESQLPKLLVAGSIPVSRSISRRFKAQTFEARGFEARGFEAKPGGSKPGGRSTGFEARRFEARASSRPEPPAGVVNVATGVVIAYDRRHVRTFVL